MKSYVYYVVNNVNGKKYVGKSNDPVWRFNGHIADALRHNSMLKFHCAIRKHGAENFEMHVYNEYETEELAYENETILIRAWNTVVEGYNMNEGGVGGLNPSQEIRDKISIARTGKMHTPEAIKKMSDIAYAREHKPHSEEAKVNMRKARQKLSEEGKQNESFERRGQIIPTGYLGIKDYMRHLICFQNNKINQPGNEMQNNVRMYQML